MESTQCTVIIQNSKSGKRLSPSRSTVISTHISPVLISFILLRGRFVRTRYNLDDLDGLYTDDAYPDRMALRFGLYEHNVILICQDITRIQTILSAIHRYMTLKNRMHIVNNGYRLDMDSYSCRKYYDIESIENNLTNVLIENVHVRSLKGLARMQYIQCISLTGSTLGKTALEKETFWNWMSSSTISKSLTVLILDNVDLREVPFEMRNLYNLETLSMADNKLVSLISFNFLRFN